MLKRLMRAEDEGVHNQRDFYAALLKAQSDLGEGLVVMEGERISYANEAFLKISGYTLEELLSLPTCFELLPAEERASFKECLLHWHVDSQLRVDRHETVILQRDGGRAELECAAKALVEDDGRTKLLVLTADITERKRAQKRLRRSLDALLALHEAGQVLVSSLNSWEVAQRLLEIVKSVSGLSVALISIRNEHQSSPGGVRLTVGSEDILNSAERTPEITEARRLALRTRSAQRFYLDNLASGSPPFSLMGLCLPLWVKKQDIIGLLEVYGSHEELADQATLKLLEGLASQAAAALENARLYEELTERERRLAGLVGRLIGAQGEQRRRVAYEVHDSLAQVAASAYRYLQDFSYLHPQSSLEAQEDLDHITDLVKQTVAEARRIIANLRPGVLDDFGLENAISFEVERLRAEGCQVSYEETLGEARLPAPVETALFRVAQEALANVRKHAHSRRVSLSLLRLGEKVRLQVRDFGRGFDTLALRRGRRGPDERVGLESMQEQVSIIGGELKIQSKLSTGTLIVADVPLPIPKQQTTPNTQS